ncbi:MAG: L-threonylcarbamoyladenylate synthase [Muribaculaceae bacterium]
MAYNTYKEDIDRAVAVLKSGGVILYPTDTVWGIGCDATNSEAVRRVYQIKRRDDSKALITLVGSVAALERVVDKVPDVGYELLDAAVDPLTIVYDKGLGVAPELLAPDGSIGVRLTAETFSRRLCNTLRRPLVSTSANVSGCPSPVFFKDISPEIIKAVDYVCTSRRDDLTPHRPSCVIRLSENGTFKILRK